MLLRLLKSRQLKIIRQFKICLGIPLAGQEVDDERVLDGEDGVFGEVRVAAVEDLRGDGFVAGGRDLVGKKGAFSWLGLGKAGRGKRGERIRTMKWMCAGRMGCRSSNFSNFPAGPSYERNNSPEETVEGVTPVFARCKAASEAEVDLVLVLLLVQPVRGPVPHVELGALDRLACQVVRHAPVHERVVAVGDVVHD